MADRICDLLTNPEWVHDLIDRFHPSTQQIETAIGRAADLARKLKSAAAGAAIDLLVECVEVEEAAVRIRVKVDAMIPNELLVAGSAAIAPMHLRFETKLARIGREMKLIIAADQLSAPPDPGLVKLVVKAFAARRAVERNPQSTIAEIAQSHGHGREYFGVLLRLSYLSPHIQSAILAGNHPAPLTRQRLARSNALSMNWTEQALKLGFTDR